MKKAIYKLPSLILIVIVIILIQSFLTNPKKNSHPISPNPLKNMFGINSYEWDFLQNPNNLNDATHIYDPKMDLIKCFGGVRHYLDWGKLEDTQGSYTFNPANSGGWNYDAIYERCKHDKIEVLTCLKNCPEWLVNTYPADQRDGENVPAPYGLNREDPASYALQAKVAFQFAARYGYNKNVNASLVKVNNKPRWTADPVNQIKIGMGLIKYIECDNERDKWWKGKQAQQTASEYAANLSAFYDGNKGKLGKNAGIKTADPSMQVVMCGLAAADPKYVQDMISWCKQNRGLKPDGSVNLCFDVINYHFYPNDNKQHANKQATRGVAPELTEAGEVVDDFMNLAWNTPKHPEVWITETGYDINPESPQRAIPIDNKPALVTQADWLLRSALLFNRHGIKRVFYYQLFDDNESAVQYSTSGITDAKTLKRRPAADYILQTTKLMGNYTFRATLNNDPLVDVYQLGNKRMYVLLIPDEKNRTATCQLNLGNAKSALIHTLKIGADVMNTQAIKTNNGKLMIKVRETPVFVEEGE